MKHRLAVVATHPVQYQAPLWRAIAADPEMSVKVFFTSRHGLDEAEDPGFGLRFKWDVPLLEGYESDFCRTRKLAFLRGPFGKAVAGNLWPLGLKRALKSGEFDAVLVLGYALPTAWAGILAGWRSDTPVIMRGESFLIATRYSFSAFFKRAILKRLVRRIDGFLAIGKWNRAYWEAFGVPPRKIVTALYSVDNDFFRACLEAKPNRWKELRKAWGAGDGHTVFLCSAKLIAAKNPRLLLDAFAGLGNHDSLHLVFVGEGPLRHELEGVVRRMSMRNVHLAGFVNQTELPHYYRAADVLVLPSSVEPWGLVVNEAMACGTPCIVSDSVGASGDLVEDGRTGLVFRSGDLEALQRAMKAAMDPVTRRAWRGGIPRVLAPATLTKNVEAIRSLLASIGTRAYGPTSMDGCRHGAIQG